MLENEVKAGGRLEGNRIRWVDLVIGIQVLYFRACGEMCEKECG
jgi:hypothetical protein